MLIEARMLTPGEAEGPLLVLDAPLSLWGGIDLRTTAIVDHTHPQCGLAIVGRILAMKESRGSSSSASALVEIARIGMAPAAILLAKHDPILIMGALVAADLYNVRIPILVLAGSDWPLLSGPKRASARASDGKGEVVLGADRSQRRE